MPKVDVGEQSRVKFTNCKPDRSVVRGAIIDKVNKFYVGVFWLVERDAFGMKNLCVFLADYLALLLVYL